MTLSITIKESVTQNNDTWHKNKRVTPRIMALSITIKESDTQDNDTQHNNKREWHQE
jgi:hypothetical protein